MTENTRVIAFYLPQFHPIPENNKWWGNGFTEWTNVSKAKPLFKGHLQPRIPADLGYYDLRLPETRESQANLARSAGIEGFCYWHYWFGNGKRLLEKPFNDVLESGKPDFPFCLAWANHSWSNKTWDYTKSKNLPTILMKQEYLGEDDYREHFYEVLKAFKDRRYIKVNGKPLFAIFNPFDFDVSSFISLWRKLAKQNGLSGIHFVGLTSNASFRKVDEKSRGKIKFSEINDAALRYKLVIDLGFDAVCSDGKTRAQIMVNGINRAMVIALLNKILNKRILNKYNHAEINKYIYVNEDRWENVYPCIIPNWDRTPRNKNAEVYYNSTPDVFRKNIQDAIELIKEKEKEHQILFLKSWNEWGEGNYIEPDLNYSNQYLNVLKNEIIT